MNALYNEIDAYAADWLRNLVAAGHIAPGSVDTRSVVNLRPADVAGYRQAHFFAGIAGWSLALRLAGWPDDREVWTGSCPCQPFSAAGQRKGFDDERHLWPAWFRLIRECRPAIVFGEQVEAAVRLGWLDAVFADLEAEGYACAATVLGAHSVGAPHIRQRLWFVAYTGDVGRVRWPHTGGPAAEDAPFRGEGVPDAERRGDVGLLGHAGSTRLSRGECAELSGARRRQEGRATEQPGRAPWADLDWLPCRDGKARPVESGTFPLAHGIPGRVGRLRAYGNAIVPQVAAAFIAAVMDSLPQLREAA